MNKTIEYYMGLPYTIELWRAPEGGWVVGVKELTGCLSQGETAEEALEMIQDAMRGWLEVSIEMGDAIPEPRAEEDYSGKFVVRVPRSLHRRLVETAESEGVSLNQYINVALAQVVGRPAGAPEPRAARGRSHLRSPSPALSPKGAIPEMPPPLDSRIRTLTVPEVRESETGYKTEKSGDDTAAGGSSPARK
jgi:antitoxin HicB